MRSSVAGPGPRFAWGAEDLDEQTFANRIRVHEMILAGWLAKADGETEDAVRHLRRAAELEEGLEKHPITPGALLPPRETLGELLLALDRPVEALAAFRSSGEAWPGRYRTLLGAARAAAAAGDEDTAHKYYGMLLETTALEFERSEITEAREALGKT